jgi:DNA-binding PadR family transcriptional regulator
MTPGLLLLVSLLLSVLFGAACFGLGFLGGAFGGMGAALRCPRARSAVLAVLAERDLPRDDILRTVAIRHGFEIPAGLIWPLLRVLQQEGLVHAWDSGKLPEWANEGRGRVFYGLTEAGRQAAREGS